MKTILANNGSVLYLNRFSLATHIVCPRDFDIAQLIRREPRLFPRDFYKYIVNDDWLRDSLASGHLMSLINYQAIIDPQYANLDDTEDIGEWKRFVVL